MELSYETVRDILERWSIEGIVTDWCSEFGEPGYRADGATPVVVLGTYWCRCGTPEDLHDKATHHPRLWQQLEDQGVSFEWYDEWVVDYDKAYRTSGDSYIWQPSVVLTDGGHLLTPDDDVSAWLDWALEDPVSRCLLSRVTSSQEIEEAGFSRWNGQYESGWHPHQTDDPGVIAQQIREHHGDDVEIVFLLDSTGQFDVAFSAYQRAADAS